MLKLALNGVYGASNDKFSIFYDPLFTMRITLGGQMMLALLAEQLMGVSGVEIISCNTDGICLYLKRDVEKQVKDVASQWESLTRLSLEFVRFRKMFVRDVNNYISVYDENQF